ncbi:MAG: tyrosine-type recombinase/integrase [Rhodopila sp.]
MSLVRHPWRSALALRLLALTVLRPGELRAIAKADFEDLDGPAPLLRMPAERMKMKKEHLVPLSRQAVATAQLTCKVAGNNPLVFPSSRHPWRPMSENSLGCLLNRAGYFGVHVPHGFRASFSSVMNERHRADRLVIDLMLAHV